ncbi:hypothetical protein ACE5IU_18525 [Leptospira kirschneri]
MILKYLECAPKPKKIVVVPTKTVASGIFNRFESLSIFVVGSYILSYRTRPYNMNFKFSNTFIYL